MTANKELVDKYYNEFFNEHLDKLGGVGKIRLFQFRFRLYPINGESYYGKEELLEQIKKDEVMNGQSIYCTPFMSGDTALSLAKKFANLIKYTEDFEFNEENIKEGELYFFVAFVFTLDEEFNKNAFYQRLNKM